MNRATTVAVAIGVVLLGISSLTLGVVVHLDFDLTRRVVRATVNRVFRATFRGSVELGTITELTPDSLGVATFVADTPAGERVIAVEDVRVSGSWLRSLLGVALAGGDATLAINHVRVERGVIGLTVRDGQLSLPTAFRTTKRRDTEPTKADRAPSRFGLRLHRIELGDVQVRGAISQAVPFDGTVSRVLATLELGPHGVMLDVQRSALSEERLLGARTTGTADFHLRAVRGASRRLALWGTFGGHLGSLQLTTRAQLNDAHVSVRVDLPRVGSEELAPWIPTRPLQRPVAATATLTGRWPLLRLDGSVRMPAIAGASSGSLAMTGSLYADDRALFDGHVTMDGFDMRLLDPALPSSAISAQTTVRGRLLGADSDLLATVVSQTSTIDGRLLPAIEGVVAVAQAGIEARVVVHEPGSPLDALVQYRPARGVRFALRGKAPALERVPRLAALAELSGPLRGHAVVHAEGEVVDEHIDVTASANVARLAVAGAAVAIDRAQLRGRLHGHKDALALDATIDGGHASIVDWQVEQFHIAASGPLAAPRVTANAQDEHAREYLASGQLTQRLDALRNVKVAVQRGADSIEGEVELIHAGRALSIEDIHLRGLGGQLDGTLRVVQGDLVGELHGQDIDLKPLSRLLGLPHRLRGKASVDISMQRDAAGRHGHASVKLDDVGVLLLDGITARFDAIFDGHKIRPTVELGIANAPVADTPSPCDGPYVKLGIDDGELYLNGPLLEATAWEQLSGTVHVNVGHVDLACLAELVPERMLPLSKIDGTIAGKMLLATTSEQTLPSIHEMTLTSQGLKLAGRRPDAETPPVWDSDALDVRVDGEFDGADGEVDVDVSLVGHEGSSTPLLRLGLGVDLDLNALLSGGQLASPKAVRRSLEHAPISLKLQMNRTSMKRLKALPAPIRGHLDRLEGDVDVDVFVEGTARDPAGAVRIRGWELATPLRGDWDLPDEVDFIVGYHQGAGRIDGKLGRRGKTLAIIAGESKGDISARLLGGSDPRWTGWLDAKLRGIPLQTLPHLAAAGVTGELAGNVSIRGLGSDPRVTAKLSAPQIVVGNVVIDDASLALLPSDDGDELTLDLALPTQGGGGLSLTGRAKLAWKDRLYPSFDANAHAALDLRVADFPLAVFQPAVGDGIHIAGNLDGTAQLRYDKGGRDIDVDVDIAVSEAMARLPGQELHDVAAHIKSSPGLLRIDDISLSVNRGKATGWLLARMDGLDVRDVTGTVVIDEREAIPIAVDAVPLGSMSGVWMLNATRRGPNDRTAVVISSANLQLELPPSAQKDVQSLDDHPDVFISHPLQAPVTDSARGDDNVDITIALSRALIRGNQVRFELSTNPDKPLTSIGGDELTGEVLLSGGEFTLLDKRFAIERGLVRMGAAPGNPYVNVTARWQAPDGSLVYMDYVGLLKPISREKIRFRSSPPRTQREILSLLLLGDPDSGSDQDHTQGGDRAGSLGRGIAASQFNAVLGQVAPGLSTRFGASDGYLSTSVGYQVNDSVTVSATYETADASGGTVEAQGAADTSSPDAIERRSFSVDWRFATNWLLRGTVGVGDGVNNSVDLLFHHRY